LFTDLINIDELKSYDEIKADKEFIDKEVKKAKFKFLGFFGKAHNIVIYIRNSDDRADYFRKLVGRIILIDNRTKWNS
jgi:hypothetical protein